MLELKLIYAWVIAAMHMEIHKDNSLFISFEIKNIKVKLETEKQINKLIMVIKTNNTIAIIIY